MYPPIFIFGLNTFEFTAQSVPDSTVTGKGEQKGEDMDKKYDWTDPFKSSLGVLLSINNYWSKYAKTSSYIQNVCTLQNV